MPFCELQLNLHMSLWEFLKFFIAGIFENLKESKCSMSKPVYFPVDDDWHVLDSIETLPSKLLVALPNIFFFLPEDKSIVCFTWLSTIRLSSNRLRIRSKRLCSQGSWERSTEKLSFLSWITNTHVNQRMKFEVNYAKQQGHIMSNIGTQGMQELLFCVKYQR